MSQPHSGCSASPSRPSRAKAVRMRWFLVAMIRSSMLLRAVLITLGLAVLVTYAVERHDIGTGAGLCSLIWTTGGGICKFRKRLFKSPSRKQEGQSAEVREMSGAE